MLKATVVLLAPLLLASCGRRPGDSPCRTGDITAQLDPSLSHSMQETYGPWIHHARECRVGEFVIDTPEGDGTGEILVSRQGRVVFYQESRQTFVLDEAGKRFAFASNKNTGGSTTISYTTFSPSRKAWIETVDADGDGSVDFRFINREGQPSTTEFIVDQRWLQAVRRGGQNGVVLDGEFMTAEAAREKLAARRTGSAK